MWLVKFEGYYFKEEFEVRGLAVMSTGEFARWAHLVEEVANRIDSGHEFRWYFGDNEFLSWSKGAHFKSGFICEVVTNEEAHTIESLLIDGMDAYGFFPSSERLQDFLMEG